MQLEIEMSRTIQVKQYEPLTVKIKATENIETETDYCELRDNVNAMVIDTIAKHIETVNPKTK